MLNLSPPPRLLCRLLLGCCLLLQSCAAGGQPSPSMKIGMHIDAVLEFVMAYPLDWHKDRRLAYGSKEGEVRWTPPGQPTALLRVKSSLPRQPAVSLEQQLDQFLREYRDLHVQTREQVTLDAGEAWHVSGQTSRETLQLYLLNQAERSYLITLTTPAGNSDRYEQIMARAISSFQILR